MLTPLPLFPGVRLDLQCVATWLAMIIVAAVIGVLVAKLVRRCEVRAGEPEDTRGS